MIGRILQGRYRVEAHLGGGNQGDVYRANDERLWRKVAIKLMRLDPGVLEVTEMQVQAFRREARLTAMFEHPHVVQIYACDSTPDGLPFLVMEYVKGQTLNVLQPRLSAVEVLQFMTEVCSGLQHAHERGLVHRDVKPGNLMLVNRGKQGQRFMILDLGIAKLSTTVAEHSTTLAKMTFKGAGTPLYMSPEQIQGAQIDHRSDIYSLGMILFELFTGSMPFQAHSGSLFNLLSAVAHIPAPRISQAAPGRRFTPELEDLIADCLEKDPARRPGSMDEMLHRFRATDVTQALAQAAHNTPPAGLAELALSTVAPVVQSPPVQTPVHELEAVVAGTAPSTQFPIPIVPDPPASSSPTPAGQDAPLRKAVAQSIGLQLVWIPAGEFLMGNREPLDAVARMFGVAPQHLADEYPAHRVRLTRPFYMGMFEVTQGEYARVMRTNPSWFSATGMGQRRIAGQDTSRFPVENASWFDAIEFCNRLSELEGRRPYYELAQIERSEDSIDRAQVAILGGHGYRLPTEAEWEYACRGGTTTQFSFGARLPQLDDYAWYDRNSDAMTHPVGSKRPNAFGLFDMQGNVREWCEDWYQPKQHEATVVLDPDGPQSGTLRVIRGSGWRYFAVCSRTAFRFNREPSYRSFSTGFRIVRGA